MSLPTIALSVRQAWAHALIYLGKDCENRTQFAIQKGRMDPGRLAIHASAGMTRMEYESARAYMLQHCGVECPPPDELVRGAIIGSLQVTDVVSKSISPWFMGPKALVCRDAVRCDPIPCKGQLGYFTWEESGTVAEILPWMRNYGKVPATKAAIEIQQGGLL